MKCEYCKKELEKVNVDAHYYLKIVECPHCKKPNLVENDNYSEKEAKKFIDKLNLGNAESTVDDLNE
jgi:phage FluMu protein Com